MIIKLSNEYKIVTNTMEFVVQKMNIIVKGENTKEENVGKENWTSIGYFPKINQAIQCVSKHILLVNDDLDVIVNKLNEIDIKVEEIRHQLENTRVKDLIKQNKIEETKIEDEEEVEF